LTGLCSGHPVRAVQVARAIRIYARPRTIDVAVRACHEAGVLACVHPHLGTESERETIMELTDPRVVFFCPDTAHLTAAGMDPATMIRRHGDRLRYMHIKDLPGGAGEERVTAAGDGAAGTEQLPIFCELGRGVIDYGPLMTAIHDVAYDGWITVEIDRSTTTPEECLRVCADYLRQELHLSLDA